MTAVALRWADDRLGPADLLEGYRAYVDALPVNTGSRCARVRAARAFVHRNPDLSGWMSRATPVRLGDLHRGKAWPFMFWLILEGQLRPDVELLLGKPGGTGLPTEWATRPGADRDRLIRAGRQLGWSENWIRQVSLLAASTLCLHAGVPLDGLRDEHFTDLLAELDRAGCVSVSARRKVRTRLFALRQACYQLGVLARPPRKGGPVAGTPAEHARAVRQPEVRPSSVRHHDQHNVAANHSRRPDQGAACLLRLPGRPAPAGPPSRPARAHHPHRALPRLGAVSALAGRQRPGANRLAQRCPPGRG